MHQHQGTREVLLEGYVTKEQLADAFSVSVRTIDRWICCRQLPKPVRLGKYSLFPVDLVREHLKDRQAGASKPRRR